MRRLLWRQTVKGNLLALAVFTTSACFSVKSDPALWQVSKDPDSGRLLMPVGATKLIFDIIQELQTEKLKDEAHRLIMIEESLPLVKSKPKRLQLTPTEIAKSLPGTNKECIRNLYRGNTQRYFVPKVENVPSTVEIVSIGEINRLMHPNGWSSLAEQRPGVAALISVARPGPCQDEKTALLYLTVTSAESVTSLLMLTEFKDNHWSIKQKINLTNVDH